MPNEFKNNVLSKTEADLRKAIIILDSLDRNFGLLEIGNYCNIVRGCSYILANVRVDLGKLQEPEEPEEKR